MLKHTRVNHAPGLTIELNGGAGDLAVALRNTQDRVRRQALASDADKKSMKISVVAGPTSIHTTTHTTISTCPLKINTIQNSACCPQIAT